MWNWSGERFVSYTSGPRPTEGWGLAAINDRTTQAGRRDGTSMELHVPATTPHERNSARQHVVQKGKDSTQGSSMPKYEMIRRPSAPSEPSGVVFLGGRGKTVGSAGLRAGQHSTKADSPGSPRRRALREWARDGKYRHHSKTKPEQPKGDSGEERRGEERAGVRV